MLRILKWEIERAHKQRNKQVKMNVYLKKREKLLNKIEQMKHTKKTQLNLSLLKLNELVVFIVYIPWFPIASFLLKSIKSKGQTPKPTSIKRTQASTGSPKQILVNTIKNTEFSTLNFLYIGFYGLSTLHQIRFLRPLEKRFWGNLKNYNKMTKWFQSRRFNWIFQIRPFECCEYKFPRLPPCIWAMCFCCIVHMNAQMGMADGIHYIESI